MTFAFPGLRREGRYWEEDTMSKTPKVTAFLLTFLVAACAACASPQPPTSMVRVPDKLKPGASESLAMIVPAKGVQIYECRARKDRVGEYEWAFVAPEADLFDARGNRVGIDRWQQDLGYGEGACRCASGRRHSLAASCHEVRRLGRLVQQGHGYTARQYRWRRGA